MFRQGSDGAGDAGVEGLDPSHVGFRDTVSPKGMPDEVVGHSVKSLLQVKDRHVYWLFLLTVPLQEQPCGMDCIGGAVSLDKAALIWQNREYFLKPAFDNLLEDLHCVA